MQFHMHNAPHFSKAPSNMEQQWSFKCTENGICGIPYGVTWAFEKDASINFNSHPDARNETIKAQQSHICQREV